MKNNVLIKLGLLLLGIAFCFGSLLAEVVLPRLISSGMVLQRDIPVKIWGWGNWGEQVTVNFLQDDYTVHADSSGMWAIMLPPLSAGGPYCMSISGENLIELNDILIGDVWVCSGQSNMELSLQRVAPLYPEEIAQADFPEIRYFLVPKKYDFKTPQADLPWGSWQEVNPDMAGNMAAVPYFFAKELYSKYGIPIGLINASLGGSPIEAWMSEEALVKFPDHFAEAIHYRNDSLIAQITAEDKTRADSWYQESWELDKGHKDPSMPWYSSQLDDSEWPLMNVPGYWADTDLGAVNGVVWFRKKILLLDSMNGKPARLILGRIVDADSAFVNGRFVGTVSYQYPPRRYEIPANLLKAGENTLAVRVINNSGRGGFIPEKPYEIEIEGEHIPLYGKWSYRLGAEMPPLASQTFIRWKPMGLYNAMIAPLLQTPVKGILWYQGESNAENPREYADLFPAMINDWRQKWDQGDVPFLYVQLPNFMKADEKPGESKWAEFRQVQLEALELKNTGMAVTIDIGEWNDIHPLNKEDVGKRLALLAQKIAYREKNIAYSGPLYESKEIDGNRIILRFSHIGSGLVQEGGEGPGPFAVAGPDGDFVWAKTLIEKDRVIVWSDIIDTPVAVRYAWADNPAGPKLYNRECLPASPFTTE